MGELLQVLKDRSRGHVQRLINELRVEDRAHVVGPTRAARGFAGTAPAGVNDDAT